MCVLSSLVLVQSSKLGVVELRPVKEVELVSSHHPVSA